MDKKFWWVDIIFYFAVSLLVATVSCYFVFLIKNGIQKKQINDQILALQTVGTDQQKEQEREVLSYQKKIKDFATLFSNHEFASNVFSFMEKETLPNIWFRQFDLDEKNRQVQLSGESEDMEAFSRQLANLENNEYVKSVGSLNSALGEFAKTEFNFSLALDSKIFSYASRPPRPLTEIQTNEISESEVASEGSVSPEVSELLKPNGAENRPKRDVILIVVVVITAILATAFSLVLLFFKRIKSRKQNQQNQQNNFYSNGN